MEQKEQKSIRDQGSETSFYFLKQPRRCSSDAAFRFARRRDLSSDSAVHRRNTPPPTQMPFFNDERIGQCSYGAGERGWDDKTSSASRAPVW